MDEKKYKEAVDDIKVSQKLKNETLIKMKQTKKPKTYLKVLSAVAVVMLVVSVTYVGLKDRIGNPVVEDGKEEVAIEDEEIGLPTFENKEELIKYLSDNQDSNLRYYDDDIEFESSSADMPSITSFSGTISSDSASTSKSTNSVEQSVNTSDEADYSTTNNQVEGVEEADIIKTDGTYIYYISRKSGDKKILIIDAEKLEILDKIDDFETKAETMNPIEMFITDDKLIVIAEKWKNNYNFSYSNYISTDSVCALIYDITNKEKVKYERSVEIDGNYLSSRMIDNNLYFISQKYVYFYKDIDEREIIPYYTDTAVSKKEKAVSWDCIYYFPETEEHTYINVVGVNVEKEDEANVETFIGASSDIYSSENFLYLTKSSYDYNYNRIKGTSNTKSSTEIYKLKLDNSKISLKAKGRVNGTIINQFSMDEYKGNLRIATTSYNKQNDTENNIYILDEDLEEIGSIEGLAEDEKIYSVRFIGKTGYVVTFKQVDPLFVIDLSDPEEPEVKGKLKIPGYSSYLHPYDETHIIGIGKNTEETKYGSTISTNMKMSMFDVSDLEDPKEMFSVSIGGSGTYSEILDNHKALFFNKEKNLIGFPITIYEDEDDYYDPYRTKLQGAIIYEIDLEKNKEFKEKGTISLKSASSGYYSYDYNKVINRIIYIEDKIYAASNSLMKVVDIDTLEEKGTIEY